MNKHHLPEHIESLAASLSPFCKSIQTVDETSQLLGSGGALWNARNILSREKSFLIANGDEVLLPRDKIVLSQLNEKFQNDKALCTLLTCDHPELLKSLKAVWVNSEGDVKGFGMEPPEEGLKPVHYTGYKMFSSKIFDWLPEGESNIFYPVLSEAIAQGKKISTYHLGTTAWFETGNIVSFLEASNLAARNQWSLINDRREFFEMPVLFKKEDDQATLVTANKQDLEHFADCRGLVVLGENVDWPSQATLENAVIANNQKVRSVTNHIILEGES